MNDGTNCFLQQAFIQVLLHLTEDTTDRMKLLMPIWFSNEETKIIIIVVVVVVFTWSAPKPIELHGEFSWMQWSLALISVLVMEASN